MRRGEVWLINLDPTVGSEIKKTRPAVIVNDDAIGVLPLRVIVPITAWQERYAIAPWMVRLDPAPENGLEGNISAQALQDVTRDLATVLAISYGKTQIGRLAEARTGLSIAMELYRAMDMTF